MDDTLTQIEYIRHQMAEQMKSLINKPQGDIRESIKKATHDYLKGVMEYATEDLLRESASILYESSVVEVTPDEADPWNVHVRLILDPVIIERLDGLYPDWKELFNVSIG